MKINLRYQDRLTRSRFWLKLALLVPCYLLPQLVTNKNPQRQATNTGEGGFELADANHDGKLSRAEASNFLVGEIFDARDTNHDGQITKAEWTAADPHDAASFKQRDANHDGIMTREEAVKYSQKRGLMKKAFDAADKNHDGFLDRAEIQAYYASREGNPR
jgi:hypothetical protein